MKLFLSESFLQALSTSLLSAAPAQFNTEIGERGHPVFHVSTLTTSLASGANPAVNYANATPPAHKSYFELALQVRRKRTSRGDKPLLVETKQGCWLQVKVMFKINSGWQTLMHVWFSCDKGSANRFHSLSKSNHAGDTESGGIRSVPLDFSPWGIDAVAASSSHEDKS